MAPPDMYQGLGMQMAQRQEMVMTPQMIQSMELLQMPLMELEQRLQTELLENPALELADLKDDLVGDNTAGDSDDDGDYEQLSSDDADYASEEDLGYEYNDLRHSGDIDCDWNQVYDDCAPGRGYGDDEEEYDIIANASERGESYIDHLFSQMVILEIDEKTRKLAEKIIGLLDENGYLSIPLDDVPNAGEDDEHMVANEDELVVALQAVQSLHPAGTGARDLVECLLLQLESIDDPACSLSKAIVRRRLEDLAANRLPQISKSEGVSIEEVKEAARLIHSLDPRPGLAYASDSASGIRPDVIIELVEAKKEDRDTSQKLIFKRQSDLREARLNSFDEKGEIRERMARVKLHEAQLELEMYDEDDQRWEVSLPSGPAPEISDTFLALYDNSGRGELVRQAIMQDPEKAEEFESMQKALGISGQNRVFRERFMAANDIVRAVRQREITIFRVAREIVARQRDYLSGRSPAPAPLMMKEVAENLEIDIGTVSRTARDKYAQTPLGLRPLREFFTRSVASATAESGFSFSSDSSDEGGISNIQIRNRIKEMIDNEDKRKPLKDDVIQGMLEKEGIVIKRRTVAKHRLKLGYKNYSQRREY